MALSTPCVGPGRRCYGAPAFRSAASGAWLFTSPSRTIDSRVAADGGVGAVTAFPHLWTALWTESGGGGVQAGGSGRAVVECLCRRAAYPCPGRGLAELLR